jgi:hypothetical protein
VYAFEIHDEQIGEFVTAHFNEHFIEDFIYKSFVGNSTANNLKI